MINFKASKMASSAALGFSFAFLSLFLNGFSDSKNALSFRVADHSPFAVGSKVTSCSDTGPIEFYSGPSEAHTKIQLSSNPVFSILEFQERGSWQKLYSAGDDAIVYTKSDSLCATPTRRLNRITPLQTAELFCPADSKIEAVNENGAVFCASSTDAFGPFPRKLVELCVTEGGGEAECEQSALGKEFTKSLWGDSKCPLGSTQDDTSGFCVENGEAFGPFSKTLVDKCLEETQDETVCKSMRWGKDFLMSLMPPPETNDIIDLSKKFVGFSYWWGGGALSTTSKDYGSCRKINGQNDYNGHSGPFGADCSGFISKVWQHPSAMPLESQKHPFSTADYMKTSGPHWNAIDRGDTREGDAMVYRKGNGGHIFIYERGDAWGRAFVYEAKGCDYGVVYNEKSIGAEYKSRRRK